MNIRKRTGKPDAITFDGWYQIDGRFIFGNIILSFLPEIPLALAILSDGQLIQRIVLDNVPENFSDDLFRIGFDASIDPQICDAKHHKIAVFLEGTRIGVPTRDGVFETDFIQTAIGNIDTFDGARLTGWAFDVSQPEIPVSVRISGTSGEIAATLTGTAREDVNQAYGIAGRHGYSLLLPPGLTQEAKGNLRVLCNDVELRQGKEKFSFGIHLAGPKVSLTENDRFQGRVEVLNSEQISGWAFDSANPTKPVHLTIFVDDHPELSVLANIYQARLKGVNGSGCCGFKCELPARLMNGQTRSVAVRFAASGQDLLYSPGRALFPLVDFFTSHGSQPRKRVMRSAPQKRRTPARKTLRLPANIAGSPLPVSMIILNLDGAQLLGRLLESICAHRPPVPFEIILIDHGSVDASQDVVSKFENRLPIQFVQRERNYSFSASNNFAAGIARGEYLLFLNNDLEFCEEICAPMLARFTDDHVGAVGIRLLEPIVTESGATELVSHHEGIAFHPSLGAARAHEYAYLPVEIHQPASEQAAAVPVAGVTAAVMMCRKSDFAGLGGFNESYDYGLEDVDLCWSIWMALGKQVICDTTLRCIHYRSHTRDARGQSGVTAETTRKRQESNRNQFLKRLGRPVRDAVVRSIVDRRIADRGILRHQPLRITFAVTEATAETGAGDFYTAMELAQALKDAFGWEALFAPNPQTQIDATDVLVAMRHDFALRKTSGSNPGLITVAWIRNRVDEWLASGNIADYDVRFCSSQLIKEFLEKHGAGECHLLPLATNPQRFKPQSRTRREPGTVFFTGSQWGDERSALSLLDGTKVRTAVYGKGWDNHAQYKNVWRGWVSYWNLNDVYSRAALVLDDSHPVTRDWNSLNSRPFDAIAAGALPLTNCVEGAQELFGKLLPTFSNQKELLRHIRRFNTNPEARSRIAEQLRQKVLAQHTYAHRAATFQSVLSGYVKGRRLKIAIKIGVPDAKAAHLWGDFHFARGLQRALTKIGFAVRIDLLPEWYSALTGADDIVIVLRGLSAYEPRPDRINLLWVISHPQAVRPEECNQYDHVFAASDQFVATMAKSGVESISTLLQCTDPEVFYRDKGSCPAARKLLFVGNSRKQKREAVMAAIEGGLDLHVYGSDWSGLIPDQYIRGEHIPNDRLRRYYTSARIVLNDHWDDMRQQGFISNRIFDAAACGAVIVSDHMPEIAGIFGDCVVTYSNPDELPGIVQALSGDAALRRSLSARSRETVAQRHTFDARATEIYRLIGSLLPSDQPAKPSPVAPL